MTFDTSFGADSGAEAGEGRMAAARTSPVKTHAGTDPAGKTLAGKTFADQRRLQRLCEWRTLARKAKSLAGEGRAGDANIPGGAGPEQKVAAHRRWLASEAARAESDFWSHLVPVKVPQGARFVPFLDSKLFTAAECLNCPLQEASRRSFRWLSQIRAVERALARATERESRGATRRRGSAAFTPGSRAPSTPGRRTSTSTAST